MLVTVHDGRITAGEADLDAGDHRGVKENHHEIGDKISDEGACQQHPFLLVGKRVGYGINRCFRIAEHADRAKSRHEQSSQNGQRQDREYKKFLVQHQHAPTGFDQNQCVANFFQIFSPPVLTIFRSLPIIQIRLVGWARVQNQFSNCATGVQGYMDNHPSRAGNATSK